MKTIMAMREARGKCKDITGIKFGRLTPIKLAGANSTGAVWLCSCECGNTKEVSFYNMRRGSVKSCGCLHRDTITTHGKTGSRLYRVWRGMRQRCEDSNTKDYKRYGGRGISVCEEWKNDFEIFESWMLGNGYDVDAAKGKCTIDRIDADGNYSPENCRIVDVIDQGSNKKNNRVIEYNGETKTISEWARITGYSVQMIRHRLEIGKTPSEALTLPMDEKQQRKRKGKTAAIHA